MKMIEVLLKHYVFTDKLNYVGNIIKVCQFNMIGNSTISMTEYEFNKWGLDISSIISPSILFENSKYIQKYIDRNDYSTQYLINISEILYSIHMNYKYSNHTLIRENTGISDPVVYSSESIPNYDSDDNLLSQPYKLSQPYNHELPITYSGNVVLSTFSSNSIARFNMVDGIYDIYINVDRLKDALSELDAEELNLDNLKFAICEIINSWRISEPKFFELDNNVSDMISETLMLKLIE